MDEATSRVIYFDNFVHPNRWVSFYGQWYLTTKVLIDRLRAEASFLFQQCKMLEESGVKLPAEGPDAQREWGESTAVGESKSIQIRAFEAEVEADVPTSFPFRDKTQAGLVAARQRLRKLRFNDVPALQFAVRATEMAFCDRARCFVALGDGKGKEIEAAPPEPFPTWVSGGTWEHGYKVKRTVWNRFVFGQRFPFAKGFAMRYRVHWMAVSISGSDHDRLRRYVRAFFMRSGKTAWPTVRQAGRAMKWSQKRVEDAATGDPKEELSLTGEGGGDSDSKEEVVIISTEEFIE
jgi:hypothetical protein